MSIRLFCTFLAVTLYVCYTESASPTRPSLSKEKPVDSEAKAAFAVVLRDFIKPSGDKDKHTPVKYATARVGTSTVYFIKDKVDSTATAKERREQGISPTRYMLYRVSKSTSGKYTFDNLALMEPSDPIKYIEKGTGSGPMGSRSRGRGRGL